jgi:hypothetical protein
LRRSDSGRVTSIDKDQRPWLIPDDFVSVEV